MHFKKYSNSLHLYSLSFNFHCLPPPPSPSSLSFSHLPLSSLFPPVPSLSPSILLHFFLLLLCHFPPVSSSPFPSISFSAFLVLSPPLPPPLPPLPTLLHQIALSLLMHHKEAILQCRAMEPTCIYLKNKLPEEILTNMSTILENALKIDLGNRLQSFETEFWVMEELSSSFPVDLDAPDLESMNEALRKQNRALIEQLAIAHGAIRNLEDAVQELQQKFEAQLLSSKLDRYVSTLCAFAKN